MTIQNRRLASRNGYSLFELVKTGADGKLQIVGYEIQPGGKKFGPLSGEEAWGVFNSLADDNEPAESSYSSPGM